MKHAAGFQAVGWGVVLTQLFTVYYSPRDKLTERISSHMITLKDIFALRLRTDKYTHSRISSETDNLRSSRSLFTLV